MSIAPDSYQGLLDHSSSLDHHMFLDHNRSFYLTVKGLKYQIHLVSEIPVCLDGGIVLELLGA